MRKRGIPKRLWTVSYTHLDVYKRQELNISKEEVHDVLQDQFSSFIGNTQGQCVRV